jgi:hypothetical protein
VPVLACQAMPIPYLEGGLVGAMEHQCGLAMAWASEEASVVVVVLDAAGRDGVAIMVTRGKF